MAYKPVFCLTLFLTCLIHFHALGEDKKVSLRQDGVLLMGKKAFFPIGTYRDPRDTLFDFRAIKSAGFNLTHSYYFEGPSPLHNGGELLDEPLKVTAQRYLRVAHKNGLKVFMGLPRDLVQKGDVRAIKEFVLALKSEPALLVWYLMDEPGNHGIPGEMIKKINRVVKDADPDHPTFLVLMERTPAKPYNNGYDIAGFMSYDGSAIHARQLMAKKRKKIGEKIPIWMIVGAHQDRAQLSPDKLRAQVFLSAMSGAKGVLFYWWPNNYQGKGNILKTPPGRWEGICSIVKDINKMAAVLMDGVESQTTREMQVDTPPEVFASIRQYQEELYVFLVNGSEKKAAVKMGIGPLIQVSEALNPETKLEQKNGALSLFLPPFGVSVIKLKGRKVK